MVGVSVPGGIATEATLTALLAELAQKLETGQAVDLSAGTLAALESITATVANLPSDYPDAATVAKMETVRALLAGALTAKPPVDTSVTGSLTASSGGGSTLTMAVPAGADTAMFDTGFTAFVATVQLEVSVDGGANYRAMMTASVVGNNPASSVASQQTQQGVIPPGASHVRMRCSAYTSGTVACTISVGYHGTSPAVSMFGSPQTIPVASATGTALTQAKVLSAASTNATSIKANGVRVYGWTLTNISAAAKYVRLFNKASAPTVGTDSPATVLAIPAGVQVSALGAIPLSFGTGLGYAITNLPADLDATAVAANDVVGTIFYI